MAESQTSQGGLTVEEKRRNVIRLVFDSQRARFEEFCRVIADAVPEAARVVLRGSAVTGRRWDDDAPFDAEGPGTSDVDLTLVGSEVVALFKITGFFLPGIHSRPLSDDDPEIAPRLVALRRRLMEMVRRPVNIQATLDFVMYLRGDLLGQPYLTIVGEQDDS